VTDLSQRLLAHYGGLRGRFRLDVAEPVRTDYRFSQPETR
jgi:hypothetical protein